MKTLDKLRILSESEHRNAQRIRKHVSETKESQRKNQNEKSIDGKAVKK